MSNVELARRLGVSEATVRRRLKALLASGALQVGASADPASIGFRVHALIALRTSVSHVFEVAESFAQMREIRYVGLAAGKFNLVIQGFFRSEEEFVRFLDDNVASDSRIEDVVCLNMIKMLKRTYSWGVPALEAPAAQGGAKPS